MTGPGIHNLVLALVYREWVVSFRVVRGETLVAREIEYVEAARALGASRRQIMLREIQPNILSPVLVVGTVRMATVITLEASLSFLGLGVQSPAASRGAMVADGRDFLLDAWWVNTVTRHRHVRAGALDQRGPPGLSRRLRPADADMTASLHRKPEVAVQPLLAIAGLRT